MLNVYLRFLIRIIYKKKYLYHHKSISISSSIIIIEKNINNTKVSHYEADMSNKT